MSTDAPRPSPILDPTEVPVVGRDHQWPRLRAEALTLEAIAARLASPVAGLPLIAGDGGDPRWAADRPLKPAAVLVPLVTRPQGLQVLLTRRTAHLRAHAGQISFPGGRAEPTDADARATALREAQEEVGLAPDTLQVLGCMPTYTTVTRYLVTPVVAAVPAAHGGQAEPQEVDEIFEVPLAFLMDPAHHQRHRFETEAGHREFLSMPWRAADGGEYFIWGATAAMLRNLYHLLAGTRAPA